MYRAKAEGRNSMRFLTRKMQAEVLQRLALEQALRQAIEQDQLTLYYQPQVGSTGQIVGVEALVQGTTPSAGWCPLANLFLWRKKPASSCPWGSGCCRPRASSWRNGRSPQPPVPRRACPGAATGRL